MPVARNMRDARLVRETLSRAKKKTLSGSASPKQFVRQKKTESTPRSVLRSLLELPLIQPWSNLRSSPTALSTPEGAAVQHKVAPSVNRSSISYV